MVFLRKTIISRREIMVGSPFGRSNNYCASFVLRSKTTTIMVFLRKTIISRREIMVGSEWSNNYLPKGDHGWIRMIEQLYPKGISWLDQNDRTIISLWDIMVGSEWSNNYIPKGYHGFPKVFWRTSVKPLWKFCKTFGKPKPDKKWLTKKYKLFLSGQEKVQKIIPFLIYPFKNSI